MRRGGRGRQWQGTATEQRKGFRYFEGSGSDMDMYLRLYSGHRHNRLIDERREETGTGMEREGKDGRVHVNVKSSAATAGRGKRGV